MDANQLNGFTSFTIDGNNMQQASAQTFTAQNTGSVTSVQIGVQAVGPAATYAIGIINGANPNSFNFIGSVQVNSGTWSVGMNTVNLASAGISVVAGQSYTIGIVHTGTVGTGVAFYNSTAGYAGGDQWTDQGNMTMVAAPPFDLQFAVFVTPGAAGPILHPNYPTSNLVLSNWLYCTGAAGATNYQFRFIDMATGLTYTRARGAGNPNMPLSWVSGLQYGHTYSVTVRAYVSNAWGAYGNASTVSLAAAAPTTNLTTSGTIISCGATGLTSTSKIYARSVTGATSYRYTITGANNYNVTRVASVSNIQLSSWANTGLVAGTYTVTVTEYSGGTWSSAGMPCTIGIASNVRLEGPEENSTESGVEVGFGVAAYPNPVEKGSAMNVSITGANGQTATMRVVDITGREVHNSQVGIDADEFNTSVAIGEEYSSGIYFLQVLVNGEMTTTRFVVK